MATQTKISLDQYRKTACISAFELVLGLPLDRIKIELQQGVKTIKPTQPYLKYWYAGNIPSLIQRCIIYMPAIKLTGAYCANMPEYMKPFIVAGVISPYVSFFEGIKTAQQKQVWPLAKSNNMSSTVCTGIESSAQCNATASTSILRPFCSLFTQGFSPERKREVGLKLNVGGIIRHVIYEVKKPSLLFASIIPTYLREYCFVTGMLTLQPILYSKIMDYNTFGFKIETTKQEKSQEYNKVYTALSCLCASIICQTISQPFDVIKTRIELQPTAKVSDIITILKQNQYQYGWRSVYYAGWLPRVIRGMWTFTCMNYFIDFV